jgi:hypothetical protein
MNLFLWLIAAVVLVFLLGFAKVFSSMYNWRLWPAIRRARLEIVKAARERVPNSLWWNDSECASDDEMCGNEKWAPSAGQPVE